MRNQLALLVGASAMAVTLASAIPASAQGFFDQLFGGGRPPQATPSYGAPPDFPGAPFQDGPAAPERPRRKAMVETKPKLQKPTDLMHDATLQNGDAVMMKDGIHVYIGDDDEKRHGKGDFSALDNVDGMSKHERSALMAMDVGRRDPLRGALEPDTIASGRSAAVGSSIVKGREITDARGKTVRYVGP